VHPLPRRWRGGLHWLSRKSRREIKAACAAYEARSRYGASAAWRSWQTVPVEQLGVALLVVMSSVLSRMASPFSRGHEVDREVLFLSPGARSHSLRRRLAGLPARPRTRRPESRRAIFATLYSGCLGPLRSAIAQGQFAAVGPFGEHFTGQVDPGSHQGTVGEEEFLETVIGIPADQLQAFCAQFATH
jgi:hypothetical protein